MYIYIEVDDFLYLFYLFYIFEIYKLEKLKSANMEFANNELARTPEMTICNSLFMAFPIPWFPNNKN